MKINKNIKRIAFCVLVAGILLIGKAENAQAAEKVALTSSVFKDANLLTAVQQYDKDGDGYLDKGEIAAITDFYTSGSIADISGLEKLTGLTSVQLVYTGTSITFGSKIETVNLKLDTTTIKVNAPGANEINVSSYETSNYNHETGQIEYSSSSCKTVDLSQCVKAMEIDVSVKGMTNSKLPSGCEFGLEIKQSDIKTLKIPTNIKLTALVVENNEKLTSVTVPTYNELYGVRVENNEKLTSIKIPKYNKLRQLSVKSNSNLAGIDLKYAIYLEQLEIWNCPKIKSLSLSCNKKLNRLICTKTLITKLDISKNKELTFISCPYNNLKKLDCSNNKKLTAVQCYDNKITSLNVNKISGLKEVSCENNKITSLNMSKDDNLMTVTCYNNPLKSLYINSTTNAWKKVNIAPVIASVKQENSEASPVITIKKDNKTSDHIVWVKSDTTSDIVHAWDKSGLTYSFRYSLSPDTYSIQAVGAVKYKGVDVYAALTTYKNKVTVE
jgi:hypothetical protein